MTSRGSDVARLARADLLLALGGALCPPEGGALSRTATLAGEGRGLAEAAGGDEAMAAALEALAAAAAATPVDLAVAEYRRLFDTSVVCPIHEAGWIRRDKGAILGDVAAFFRAFGLAPRAEAGERPDHLVAELELAAVLLVLHARASSEAREEAAAVTGDALRAFAQDHLSDWLPAFALRLAESTTLEVYARLAEALARGWSAVVRAEELGGGPVRLPVVEDEAGSPYECGMQDEEGQW